MVVVVVMCEGRSGTVSLMLLQGTPEPGSCGCTGPSLLPCSYTLIYSPHNQFYPTNTTVNALHTYTQHSQSLFLPSTLT